MRATEFINKQQGVAEGSDAEAYKEKLLTTLPQIMRFFEKNGKGWKPSKEQMLAAVETGYTVMKHTGDVKQAGKAMMDELNTLHRMGQDNQDVAEGLNEFATGSGGGGKDDILKTLAAQWLNGDVSSGDLDSDIQFQEKVERRLARGIICPDGVKRKLYIDYSDDYKGVVIYSDDNWSITYKQDDLTESKQGVAEAWSEKYKKSINCKNPKGFSQRAHCQGRKKNNEQIELDERKKKRKTTKKKTNRYFYGPVYYGGFYGTGDSSGDGGGGE